MQNASKGFILGAAGLGAVGGVGLQVGRQLASSLVDSIKSVTTGFAESSRETQLFAERMGLSTVKARELENIAQIAGVNIGSLAAASRILANALEDSNGSGKKAAAALNELGIASRGATGDAREEGQVLVDLLDKLSKISDPTERARLAFVTLGRGAKEIIPLLGNLDELKAKLKELGVVYDDDIIKKGSDAQKAFSELGVAWKYLKDTVGAGLADTITPLILAAGKGIAELVNLSKQVKTTAGTVSDPFAAGAAVGKKISNLISPEVGPEAFAAIGSVQPRTPDDPSLRIDPARAAANQARIDATEEGLRRQLAAAQASLTEAQARVTNKRGTEDSLIQAERDEKAAQRQVTSLQARIDAFNNVGKAADAAEKALDKFQAGLIRLAGAGEDPLAKLASNFRGIIADAKQAGILTPKLQGQADLAYRQGQETELNKPTEASKQSFFDIKRFANSDGTLHLEATLKDSKLDDFIDKAQSESDKLARQDYTEQEKQRKQRATERGPNAIDLGGAIVDPLASIPKQRTSLQNLTTFEQNQQQRETLAGINGNDPLTVQLQVAQIEIETANARKQAEVDQARLQFASDSDAAKKDQALYDARVKNEDSIYGIRLKAEADIAAYRKQIEDQFAHTFADGIKALQGGHGVDFLKGLGTQLETSVLTNLGHAIATTSAFQGIQDSLHATKQGSFLGDLFKGTPFGPDPTKALAHTPAITSTDNNTAATLANTAALADVYGVITGGGTIPGVTSTGTPGSLSGGLFGGGSLGGGIYSLANSFGPLGTSNEFGTPGLPELGGLNLGAGDPAKLYASIFGGTPASSASQSGFGGFAGFLSGLGHTGDVSGIFSGISKMPGGGYQTLSTAERLGGAVGTAGAAAGGIETAISGFSEGGARGDLKGIAGALGTASLFAGPAAPFLAIGAGVAGLISGLFGDPRQERENQINKEIGNAKYEAPLPINETLSTNGTYMDYDENGMPRTSQFSGRPMDSNPYQWYHNGQFIQYPGREISPFQNPDLVIPPSVAANSTYNAEGVSNGGTQVVTPPSGITINLHEGAIKSLDSSDFGDFLSKPTNQMHLANGVVGMMRGSHASAFRQVMGSTLGLR